jgi:hypothetical protein
MPKLSGITTVLIIGSGPVITGQPPIRSLQEWHRGLETS